MSGELVESTQRADTMAENLEKVQWKVRVAQLVDDDPIGDPLPALEEIFTTEEVRETIHRLKRGKACGMDDIPAEYWKAIATDPGGLEWITDLCSKSWNEEAVPEDWKQSIISTIYKNKGALDTCDNYRPVSLLCVAYKLMAALILKRLQDAGAEDR